MVAELLVQRVELLARSGAHDAGHAEVTALAARPHFHRARIEVRGVLEHDLGHGLCETRLLAAHHLDREIARERQQGTVGDYGHYSGLPQAGSDSRRPARITFCLKSW